MWQDMLKRKFRIVVQGSSASGCVSLLLSPLFFPLFSLLATKVSDCSLETRILMSVDPLHTHNTAKSHCRRLKPWVCVCVRHERERGGALRDERKWDHDIANFLMTWIVVLQARLMPVEQEERRDCESKERKRAIAFETPSWILCFTGESNIQTSSTNFFCTASTLTYWLLQESTWKCRRMFTERRVWVCLGFCNAIQAEFTGRRKGSFALLEAGSLCSLSQQKVIGISSASHVSCFLFLSLFAFESGRVGCRPEEIQDQDAGCRMRFSRSWEERE